MRAASWVLLFLVALAPGLARAQRSAPPEGAWLRYHFEQHLTEGAGAYEGFTETTRAHARYTIESATGDAVTIRGRYAWAYASPDRTDSGVEDRTVTFDLPSRRYQSSTTDVSDYDDRDGRALATWIWIPPSSSPSAPVAILERDFRVMSRGLPMEIAGSARRAIALMATEQGSRDDAYGQLSSRITDRYWYDAETGMFLREVHEERCTGTFEGRPASFVLTTTIELVDSSYAPAASPPPEDSYTTPPWVSMPAPPSGRGGSIWRSLACCGGFIGVVALLVFGVTRAIRRRRRRRGPTQSAQGQSFDVDDRLKDARALPAGLSPSFDPFLPHMLRVAQAAGHPIAAATTVNDAILGVAIGDRDAAVGTIFAADSDVCEALRLRIGQSEFFSEHRHARLASVERLGISAPAEAYNVYETYEVMTLDARPEELGYDTEVVGRLKDAQRPAAVALLEQAYGVPCARWLDATLAEGDLAWIAHEGDVIVGVALATVVGTRARLHTLTVHPDHRGRGLGTALYRARLRALFDMGVTSVLTECATWNVAALELARAHGFTKSGVVYVESARHQRDERKFVRR